MPLYHCQTGFPSTFHPPLGLFKLEYTTHAKRAARRDYCGDISACLPGQINTGRSKLIEVETDQVVGTTKLVYRVKMNDNQDLVLVVNPTQGRWRVITVWTNQAHDSHRSLCLDRYEQVVAA